jgi:hypothetical protein
MKISEERIAGELGKVKHYRPDPKMYRAFLAGPVSPRKKLV